MFDRRGRRKYLNQSERVAFLRVAEMIKDVREKAFCLTLFYSGCRISEALQLRTERIDVSDGVVVFETLKQRRRRMYRPVPIPEALISMLRQLSKRGRIWKFSRTTAYRLIKAVMAEAGIAGAMASPKGLRHGFAVACVRQKIPLTTLQKWMGHRRIETIATYLQISTEEEREMARAVWEADSSCQGKTQA